MSLSCFLTTVHLARRLFRIVSSLVLVAFITGCNGIPVPMSPASDPAGRSVVLSGFPAPGFFMATAIQWNEDYAVTTRHTPFLTNVAHQCTSGCDLVFLKRKAEDRVPRWRSAVPGEEVIASGVSPFLISVQGRGMAKSTRVVMRDHPPEVLAAVHDAPVVKGMSGGPVYGVDGQVLGMTLGIGTDVVFSDTDDPLSAAHGERLSFYMPYEEIQKEWERFELIQARKTKKEVPDSLLARSD